MTLTLTRAASRKENGGWVLFGNTANTRKGRHGRQTTWLERWFPTDAAARKYAGKLNASVLEK